MSWLTRLKQYVTTTNTSTAPSVGQPFPLAGTLFYFVPAVDFFSEDTHSQYVAGLHYTVKPHNTKLGRLAYSWALQGKVSLMHSTMPKASMKGTGAVWP